MANSVPLILRNNANVPTSVVRGTVSLNISGVGIGARYRLTFTTTAHRCIRTNGSLDNGNFSPEGLLTPNFRTVGTAMGRGVRLFNSIGGTWVWWGRLPRRFYSNGFVSWGDRAQEYNFGFVLEYELGNRPIYHF